MKGKRQEKILEIIRTNDIETQEELTKKLSGNRFERYPRIKTYQGYRCKWKTEICTDSSRGYSCF